MPSETQDDVLVTGHELPFPEVRSLRTLRHRVALLLLTFSVVILPNLFSYAASLLGD